MVTRILPERRPGEKRDDRTISGARNRRSATSAGAAAEAAVAPRAARVADLRRLARESGAHRGMARPLEADLDVVGASGRARSHAIRWPAGASDARPRSCGACRSRAPARRGARAGSLCSRTSPADDSRGRRPSRRQVGWSSVPSPHIPSVTGRSRACRCISVWWLPERLGRPSLPLRASRWLGWPPVAGPPRSRTYWPRWPRQPRAQRAYVFQNRRGPDGRLWMDLVGEWDAPDVRPIFDDPKNHLHPYFPHFSRWIEVLGAGGFLAHPRGGPGRRRGAGARGGRNRIAPDRPGHGRRRVVGLRGRRCVRTRNGRGATTIVRSCARSRRR